VAFPPTGSMAGGDAFRCSGCEQLYLVKGRDSCQAIAVLLGTRPDPVPCDSELETLPPAGHRFCRALTWLFRSPRFSPPIFPTVLLSACVCRTTPLPWRCCASLAPAVTSANLSGQPSTPHC